MLDQANRTFICSVVFIDLVGYSKKTVTEQIRLKTSLTNNLSEAIKDIPGAETLKLAPSLRGDKRVAVAAVRDENRHASRPDTAVTWPRKQRQRRRR